jgi:hypothetical protein
MRYKTALLMFLMTAGLAGCATSSQTRKQAETLEMKVGRAVAVDGVDTMSRLYPPAKVQLVLLRPTTDDFGSALVSGLRTLGYAVVEPDPAATKASGKARFGQPRADAVSSTQGTGIPFDYRIVQVDSVGLYEVSLNVGSDRLARIYVLDDKRVAPVGAWTRRE